MSLLKFLKRKISKDKSPAQEEIDYLQKNGLKLGKNVRIYSDYCFDSEWPWLISVGDNTMISTDVKILAHDASTGFVGCGTKIGRVSIGKNVFIGSGTRVLCNTKIGDNSIVGANSVVSHDVPDNCVYAGCPAKFICTLDEFAAKHKNGKVFDRYSWDKWKDAPIEDKQEMYRELENGFGYVK